ncbi:hypothetical protein K8I61_20525 [bacterium]|nr:hypothetical protein [bacterium]
MGLRWRLAFTLLACVVSIVGAASCSCGDDDDDDDAVPSDDDTAFDDDADDDTGDDDADDDMSDDDTGDDDDADDDDDTDDDTEIDNSVLGVWDVTGTDDALGAYAGQVEFYKKDGEVVFARSVHYAAESFVADEGAYEVWSGWEGTAELAGEGATAEVVLRRNDFVTHVDTLARTDDDKEKEVVTGAFTPAKANALTATYASTPAGLVSATESLTRAGENGQPPVFDFDDTFYPSHPAPPAWLHDLLFDLLANYHALPFYDDYRDRPEFDAGIHFFPHFRTDYEWYRENPMKLRVANKIVDDISLTETMLRARAFGHTLGEKAAMMDAETPDKYLMEAGMIARYVIGSDPPDWLDEYDSTLWTGTYLASQAFRYQTTGEADALDNMIRALSALFICVDITDDPAIFARTVRPIEDGTPGDPAWIAGTGDLDGLEWRTGQNNDMAKGIEYGFLMALLTLPDDPAYDDLRDGIAARSVALVENDPELKDGSFNELIMSGIAYLATGDDTYRQRYDSLFNPAYELWVRAGNGMFYLWGISDWSGQHLNTVGMLTLQLLADAMDDAPRRALIRAGWEAGMHNTPATRYVLFPIAAYAFGDPGPGYDKIFEEAIWGLREVPYPKGWFYTDYRIDPGWCASPLPALFWKFDWLQGGRHQALYARPYFELNSSSCLWTNNPLEVGGGGVGNWIDASADYLHAYWLARRYGLLTASD